MKGTLLRPKHLPAFIAAANRAEEAAAALALALRDLGDCEEAMAALEAERSRAATTLGAIALDGERSRILATGSRLLAPAAVAANERFKAALRRLSEAATDACRPC